MLVFMVGLSVTINAQVTIGADKEPTQGALLDLKSDDASTNGGATTGAADGTGGGLLLPRVYLTDISKLSPFVKDDDPNLATLKLKLIGLTVYSLTVGQGGFTTAGTYTWDGLQWDLTATPRGGTEDEYWSIEGNAGTNPAGNFLGTTDNQPLVFRVNNTRAGYISSTGRGTSIGYEALNPGSNNTGINNDAFGNSTLLSNTSGSNNVAIGASTLRTNTTGSNNIAIGATALVSNTTGYSNTVVGFRALRTNTTGHNNIAVGDSTLHNSSSASYNTAIGNKALFAISSGHSNVAIGDSALLRNQVGIGNTAVGDNALANNVVASGNTAIGNRALASTSGGNLNTAVGEKALTANTSASANTAVGSNALAK